MKKKIILIKLTTLIFLLAGLSFWLFYKNIPEPKLLQKNEAPTSVEMIQRNQMVFPSKLKALQDCTGKKTGVEIVSDMKIVFYENVIYVHRNGFLYTTKKNGDLFCESLDRPFLQPPLGSAPTRPEEEPRLETLEEHIFYYAYGAINCLLSEKKCGK